MKTLIQRGLALLDSPAVNGLALLVVRLALAAQFWRSARTKVEEGSFLTINPITYDLFRDEYHMPAPEITGTPPAAGGNFLVNPPAQRVQRAQPVARAQRVERAEPVDRAQPAQPLDRAQPAPPVLPTPPAAPASPMTPYEAYSYQHARLNDWHAQQFDRMRQMQESDKSLTPSEREREMREMQRMAARQRALLDARQRANSETPTEPSPSPQP